MRLGVDEGAAGGVDMLLTNLNLVRQGYSVEGDFTHWDQHLTRL